MVLAWAESRMPDGPMIAVSEPGMNAADTPSRMRFGSADAAKASGKPQRLRQLSLAGVACGLAYSADLKDFL